MRQKRWLKQRWAESATFCLVYLLDAFSHLYRRLCPFARPSVGPSVGPSVRRSVRRSIRRSVRPSVSPSVRPWFLTTFPLSLPFHPPQTSLPPTQSHPSQRPKISVFEGSKKTAYGRTDGRTDRLMDGRMDRRTDGPTDGQTLL